MLEFYRLSTALKMTQEGKFNEKIKNWKQTDWLKHIHTHSEGSHSGLYVSWLCIFF